MKKTKKYIWDYDIKSLNLKDRKTLLWYLKRKIEYRDWENLDKRTLKKYLPQLKLDPYLKDILKDFLKKYARNTK